MPVDSRVGVSVDVTRRLHLYVNGQDQGVVSPRALPDPCYAMFDVGWQYRKVSGVDSIRPAFCLWDSKRKQFVYLLLVVLNEDAPDIDHTRLCVCY